MNQLFANRELLQRKKAFAVSGYQTRALFKSPNREIKKSQLRAAHVFAGDGGDFDGFAFLDEERDVDRFSGFEDGGFLHVVRAVAFHAFGGFDDFDMHRRRQFDLRRAAFDAEHVHFEILDEIIFRVRKQRFVERDGLIRFRIHEVIALMIFVAEFQLLPLHIDRFHLVGGAETDVGGFAGGDVANDDLHERAEVSGRAVHDFEDDGRVRVVADCHAFAEIVCECHKKIAV